MNLNIIGNRLKEIRKLARLSRQEIERKYNISVHTIKAWENGANEIGAIKLTHYLKIFQCYDIYVDMNSFLIPHEGNYLKNITPSAINYPINDSNFISPALSVKNSPELRLITDTIANMVGLILEEKEDTLQAILDYFPLNIMFKDDDNNLIRLNNQAAKAFNGTIGDFEKKNTYDLFPTLGKKYHDDDLLILNSGKPTTLIEEICPLNLPNKLVITNKIPIFSKDNKRLILAIFKDVEANILTS